MASQDGTLKRGKLTIRDILMISALIFISLNSNNFITCNRPPGRLTDSQLQDGGGGGDQPAAVVSHTNETNSKELFECEVFADYGKNYLTPVDVVVKNSEDNVACIKARFALSIKVEEAFTLTPRAANSTNGQPADTIRSILGYLPLEHVLSVEDSCPSIKKTPSGTSTTSTSTTTTTTTTTTTSTTSAPTVANNERSALAVDEPAAEVDELEMIVTFGCGKLSFTFRRDKARIYVSSIKGVVKLDKKVVREFVAVRPMFLTSDLEHHFKYDDIIEITSEAQSKTYILTANFYFTEIEAFRTSTSRDFIQPPDEKSKPFSDELVGGEPLAVGAKGAQEQLDVVSPAKNQQPPTSQQPLASQAKT